MRIVKKTMAKYITVTKFFDTGFLRPDATAMRLKQGLPPQNIVNDCGWDKGEPSGMAGNPVRMYPAGVTTLPHYGMKPIPGDCPCTQWVRSP